MRIPLALGLLASSALALAACTGGGATDPFAGFGPNPPLKGPTKSLLPTVGVAKVIGWRAGETPKAPAGFVVTRFGEALDHPRWILVLPNGDVLVAESASEPNPADKNQQGIKGFFQNMLMKKAGSQRPSPNRLILLRDADGDGRAELKTVFATGLKQPFGMAVANGQLYVANNDGVVRFAYADGQTQAAGPPTPVFSLPGGPINHHWTKSLIASPDGAKLYATVGSNSNIGENGLENETGRAAIWEYDIASGGKRLFASGLRNPNGMGWEPTTGQLWTAVNERDEIGNDLPPDYMTSVKDGGFYGWPYSYWGQVDQRVKPANPQMAAKALKPDYGLGAHTASLGLTFYTADLFPPAYKGGVFVGQHGSWNRKPMSGYRVVFVPFAGGKPVGPPQAFLEGFLASQKEVRGRPVGVAVDRGGGLLVADDAGGAIWRVAPG